MTPIERVWDYANKIVEGEIIACKKHIWAAQRFIKDINRTQEDDCPFTFDVDILEDFNEWAKEFKHSEGVLAGQPIILTDFQLFIVANIFCFLNKKNGSRRFRKVYIQLARKNAKSQLLALIATYETFLSDEKHRVYITGWSKEQSDEVYNAVLDQIRNTDILKGTYKDSYGKVTRIRTNSIIQPLSKETRKLGDGKNPSVGIVDEYHAHETSEIYDVILSGMVARKSPLMVVITTAGFDLSRPCFKEYQYVTKVLDPDNTAVENDDYFALICELDEGDDIKDERNWIKANPIVGTYEEGVDSLRSDIKVALEQPEKMRGFMTKNMNIWVDKKENGYMEMSKWNLCEAKFDLENFRNTKVFVGVDLSAKEDLTSVTFMGRLDGKFAAVHHSFIPEDKYNQRMAIQDIRFDLFVQNGYLTIIPGAVIDQEDVEKYIEDKVKEYSLDVIELCYDEWNASQFAINMEKKGFTCVIIPQYLKVLAEPTADWRIQVYKGNAVHQGDGLLTWAVSNAVTIMDPNANFKLDKKRSPDKIDPIASLLNAYARAMRGLPLPSVYEERGFVSL
ncbi:terminase large subunit [Gottfriedia sp. NPDC056225]|uniref:terminase large subunit n=1 Tax=Gottfriedia sp. NPDC056225 TaxID=3345751 RepID=UPI0035D661E7